MWNRTALLLMILSLLATFAAAFACASGDDDDDDDDDNDVADDDADDDVDDDADDDASAPCTIEDLCGPVVACGMGFTEQECIDNFTGFCAEGGDLDAYYNCVCTAVDAYGADSDCTAFQTDEATCWTEAGC